MSIPTNSEATDMSVEDSAENHLTDIQKLSKLLPFLRCLSCHQDLSLGTASFTCPGCGSSYPIVQGVPRFVPESYFNRSSSESNLSEKTKNYFGFEWDYFQDWGFIEDESIHPNQEEHYRGGRVSERKRAFDSKCRLTPEEVSAGKVILDAGCGNGRYTFEAASRGKALVIGIDLGYGSVQSAYENTKLQSNAVILQGNLFDLPFKPDVFTSAFSNGVLMHTGDAPRTFREIARTIAPTGTFVVNVYNRLNPIWECNDYILRSITTRLTIEQNLKLAQLLARVCRTIANTPNRFKVVNYFLRLQPTVHHMFDWYSAPIATHHDFAEIEKWFLSAGFEVEDKPPTNRSWFDRPWANNLRGRKKEIYQSEERKA